MPPCVLRAPLIHFAALHSHTQLAIKLRVSSQTWLPALAKTRCPPIVKCDPQPSVKTTSSWDH